MASVIFTARSAATPTHSSSTDPEAQLYRKGRGKEAKLSFMGHVLMENRSRLIVAATLTKATGTAERAAAETMIVRHSPGVRRLTPGADKGYDAAAFVADMRALNVTPHIAQNISGRRSAIDARTTRHPGYAVSQQKRKRIEEPFGWGKTEAAQLALSSFKHVCAIFAPCPGLSAGADQPWRRWLSGKP